MTAGIERRAGQGKGTRALRSSQGAPLPDAPGRCDAKCRLAGSFDRLPGQFCRLLDRLSGHLALHWPPGAHLQVLGVRYVIEGKDAGKDATEAVVCPEP